jgi:hypothetical protein
MTNDESPKNSEYSIENEPCLWFFGRGRGFHGGDSFGDKGRFLPWQRRLETGKVRVRKLLQFRRIEPEDVTEMWGSPGK